YRVNGSHHTEILEIGATRDDAAGEAYDKVAKLLGLGYPGGPLIDRLAREGDPDAIPLTKPMSKKDTFEFSFSGLKTHVARWVKENGLPENDATLRNLAAAFQRVVTDTLMEKALAAAESEGLSTIALAGGVSANSSLRERGAVLCEAQGVRFIVPDFRACTDNAAMIAYAGSFRAQRGEDDRGVLAISPRTILPRLTRKGGGPRAPLDRPPLD